MKRQETLYIYVSIAIIMLIVLLLVAIGFSRIIFEDHTQEVIVAWGIQDEISGNCKVWIMDPSVGITEQSSETQEYCNLTTTIIDNKLKLISVSYPGKITIFGIDDKNNIVPESRIDIGDWGIASVPQWGKDEKIYFSSTVNEIEQIFQVDTRNSDVIPLILNEHGLASEPVISPDGRFLVYWTLDGPSNTKPQICGLDCVSGYYHIYDLEYQTDIDFNSLLAPVLPDSTIIHCNAQWSPTGQYLAFSVGGCGSYSPQNVIIFDTNTEQIVTVVKPDLEKEDRFISFEGWLSDTEVVFGKRKIFPNMNFDGMEFYIFSIEEGVSRQLIDLPANNENGQEFVLMEPSWTQGGKKFTGTVPTIYQNGKLEKDLIILISDNPSQYRYIKSRDIDHNSAASLSFNRPTWSPSGDWIAYHSGYKEDVGSGEWLNDLYIINDSNSEEKRFKINGILEQSLNYTWLSP